MYEDYWQTIHDVCNEFICAGELNINLKKTKTSFIDYYWDETWIYGSKQETK